MDNNERETMSLSMSQTFEKVGRLEVTDVWLQRPRANIKIFDSVGSIATKRTGASRLRYRQLYPLLSSINCVGS